MNILYRLCLSLGAILVLFFVLVGVKRLSCRFGVRRCRGCSARLWHLFRLISSLFLAVFVIIYNIVYQSKY